VAFNSSNEILVVIAPEFIDMDSTGAIAVAEMQIASGLCGDRRPLLVAYLAAHILTIANKPSGVSGDIASVTEGKTSITYSNTPPSLASEGLSDTSYGREYDRLARSCIVAVRTRVDNVPYIR
jgi:hypothetical protein